MGVDVGGGVLVEVVSRVGVAVETMRVTPDGLSPEFMEIPCCVMLGAIFISIWMGCIGADCTGVAVGLGVAVGKDVAVGGPGVRVG